MKRFLSEGTTYNMTYNVGCTEIASISIQPKLPFITGSGIKDDWQTICPEHIACIIRLTKHWRHLQNERYMTYNMTYKYWRYLSERYDDL